MPALGYGKFSARQVLQKSAPGAGGRGTRAAPCVGAAPAPAQGYSQKDDDAVIKVHGVDDVMVYRAKCCNPIKGEGIVGYVTRGKGIAVHSRTCPNVQNLMYDSERKIEVDWARNASDSFPCASSSIPTTGPAFCTSSPASCRMKTPTCAASKRRPT